MVKFDNILSEINGFGRYQKFRYALICLSGLLPPLVVYLHSFIAANPAHRCTNENISNDFYNTSVFNYTDEQMVLEKCSITYYNSTKLKCDKWVFDKKYYQSTLTEEVLKNMILSIF
jgi:hypothetical protein